MIVPWLQLLPLLAAGVALFLLWRAASPRQRWLRGVVAAGFLGRALGGLALFWISWAHLPIARSLQIGDGLWVFALDALAYFPLAVRGAEHGLAGLIAISRSEPSVMYIQTLGLVIWLLGRVTSVALLLNLVCYLGAIAIIVRWMRNEPRGNTAAALAICAISLSPSLALWSLQPLKDTFFAFLVIAFVAACAAWQRHSIEPAGRGARIGVGALLTLLLFAIAALRWYFALALLATVALLLVLLIGKISHGKLAFLGSAALLVVSLSAATVVGAGPYLPAPIRAALLPWRSPQAVAALPSTLLGTADQARTGFVRTGGQTSIVVGTRLSDEAGPPQLPPATVPPLPKATPPPPAPAPAAPPGRVAAAFTPADAIRVRGVIDGLIGAWNRRDLNGHMAAYRRSPDLEIIHGAHVIRGWDQALAYSAEGLRQPDAAKLTLDDARVEARSPDLAVVVGRWHVSVRGQLVRRGVFTITERRFAGEGWKIVRLEARGAAPLVADERMARTAGRAAGLASGLSAVMLPRAIGERLGLFSVGGGRGMLWITDIDTIAFDVVMLFTLALLALHFRSARTNPVAVAVVVLTILIGLPLAYTITNFGTLFRLRAMVYVAMLLVPLAAATSATRAGVTTERQEGTDSAAI